MNSKPNGSIASTIERLANSRYCAAVGLRLQCPPLALAKLKESRNDVKNNKIRLLALETPVHLNKSLKHFNEGIRQAALGVFLTSGLLAQTGTITDVFTLPDMPLAAFQNAYLP